MKARREVAIDNTTHGKTNCLQYIEQVMGKIKYKFFQGFQTIFQKFGNQKKNVITDHFISTGRPARYYKNR